MYAMTKEAPARMGRPIELHEPWKSLALVAGGVKGIAEELGVTVRTVHRWGTGAMAIHPLRVGAVRELFKQHGLKAPK